jgi:S1-C subfamily serine protease
MYSGVGFAVPVDIVKQYVPELIQYGRIQQGAMGVRLFPDSLARQLGVRRGALVQTVHEGSGAAAAGIQPTYFDGNRIHLGDVIVEVGGREIRSSTDIAKSLEGRKPGERLNVVVERVQKRVALTVELKDTQN